MDGRPSLAIPIIVVAQDSTLEARIQHSGQFLPGIYKIRFRELMQDNPIRMVHEHEKPDWGTGWWCESIDGWTRLYKSNFDSSD